MDLDTQKSDAVDPDPHRFANGKPICIEIPHRFANDKPICIKMSLFEHFFKSFEPLFGN
jgi:hypothetical protein